MTQHKLKLATALLLTFPCFNAFAALQGALNTANCTVIKGWAWNNASPTTRVRVDIYNGTAKLATVTAQLLRNDLSIGDKKYGFSYVLPASIRNAAKHTFSVRFTGTTTELSNSPQTTAVACYGKLNDTGIQFCDSATVGQTCPVVGFPGQDAQYGRDVLAKKGILPKIGKGRAGFDFTKIANDGSVLPAAAVFGKGAKDWACTRDNVTGLIWELKTDDGGLRDKDNTYSWFNPDNTVNGGRAGEKNAGICTGGISCDTEAYIKAVNAAKLCGKSDWRMPKKSELYSIIDYSRRSPAIDTNYFPNSLSSHPTLTSTTSADVDTNHTVWVVFSYNGGDGYGSKDGDNAIRLVRSGQ